MLTASSAATRWRLPRAHPVLLVSLVGLVFLCTPRFNGWPHLHLHKEDGTVFLTDWTRLGADSLLTTYTGYVHAVPRLATAVAETVAPPQYFAIAVGVVAAAWRVWLMAICYAALRTRAVPSRRALAASSVFVFLPVGQQEALGNVTNLRWFCDAALVVLLVGRFRGRTGALAAVTAALCALTDPLALLLAPLALWALARSRGPGRLTPAVTVVSIGAHFALMDTGARHADWSGWLDDPVAFVEQILVRGPIEAQFGETGAEVLVMVLGVHLALVAAVLPIAVLAVAQDRLSLTLAGFGVYLLAATLMFTTPSLISLDNWWGVGQASRYAVTASILIGMALVLSFGSLAAERGRHLATASIAILLVAIVADAQGDPRSTDGPSWSTTVVEGRADCERSHEPLVTVPVTPVNDSTKWTAILPCSWLTR